MGPLRSGHRASGGRGAFFLFILPAREPLGGFEGDFLRVVVCVAKKISSRYEGKESA